MAASTTVTRIFTYADCHALIRDDQKADLIDGVIYMASPENTDANSLFIWLASLCNIYARKRKLGAIYGSRVACRLDDWNAPEPDLFFVRSEHLSQVRRGGIEGAPDMALEIVSPESVDRDYQRKRRQYQQFGITEYWIIDELEHKVMQLRLSAKGRYREVRPRKGVLHSEVFDGFWLDPEWLWQRPLPDELEIVQRWLANAS